MKPNLFWITALLITGSAWGFTIPLTKLAVSTGHQPLGLIFWQLLASTLILGSLAALMRKPFPLSRQTLSFCALIAILGTLVPNSFSYLAATKLPAGIMAIIISMVPIFALPISIFLKLETASLTRLLGILLGAAAILILMAPVTELPEKSSLLFLAFALIAPLCYAFEENYLALKGTATLDPLQILLGASLIGTLIAAPLALTTGQWVPLFKPWSIAEYALLGSAILHCFAYTSFIWLINKTGPVFASLVAYIVTGSGIAWSMLLLSERYSGPIWTALALILLAMTLVRPNQTKPTDQPSIRFSKNTSRAERS